MEFFLFTTFTSLTNFLESEDQKLSDKVEQDMSPEKSVELEKKAKKDIEFKITRNKKTFRNTQKEPVIVQKDVGFL